MLRFIGCVTQQHDLRLVIVALVIGAIGCLTAVALLARARHAPSAIQHFWILASAAEFGLAVWATHFVAMLAFDLGVPLTYSLKWTALSIAVAVGLTSLGFGIAVKTRLQGLGGLIVGLAVLAMHYVGIAAMTGPFREKWDSPYVTASCVVGCLVAAAAFQIKLYLPDRCAKFAKAGLLAVAIAAIHFLGMTAITLVPDPGVIFERGILEFDALTVAVSAAALFVVSLGLTSAYLDLYLERRKLGENERLKAHISELEATKLELGVALEAAYAANQTKSAFLAAMSHELRTPLNAIIGFSEIMASEAFGPLGSKRYKGYSEDIHKSGAHLLSVINDILDISRMEANKAELRESIVDLPLLLSQTLSMVDPLARSAGVRLDSVCASDVPAIWADERRIKQILLNLLSNGIKFTPAGGSVTVSVVQQEDSVEIKVQDTGIGIAKEDLPKAFESFRQIDNRLARKYEGSGLGLPLARHLAELHGATLELASEIGVGTTALASFPAFRCRFHAKRAA